MMCWACTPRPYHTSAAQPAGSRLKLKLNKHNFECCAGADPSGARLFYNCPSGNFFDYKAFAIGARSQVPPYVCISVLPAAAYAPTTGRLRLLGHQTPSQSCFPAKC